MLRGDSIARSAEVNSPAISDVFRAGNRLGESQRDEDWLRLVEQVHRTREAIEKASPHVPYVLRRLADGSDRLVPLARPPEYSNRFVAKELPGHNPPRFIGRSVFVVNGDLHGSEMPDDREPLVNERRAWKGSVAFSILVVDGSIEMQGCILSSIVVARGSLEIKKGYIVDSLVIITEPTEPSDDDAERGAGSANVGSISLEHGYIAKSIVVGDVESASYITLSRIFGRVNDKVNRYQKTAIDVPDNIGEVLR
jgi:hypothetical protein